MPSMTAAVPAGDSALWIHNRKFDLLFLSLSGVLVFFPYLSYGLLQKVGLSEATSSLIVGLSVTLLVGGPHMYGDLSPHRPRAAVPEAPSGARLPAAHRHPGAWSSWDPSTRSSCC